VEENTTLEEFLEADRERLQTSRPPVSFAPLFSDHIERIASVPHRYINLFLAYSHSDLFGEGSSEDRRTALETSICELMERCLATRFSQQDLVFGTESRLGSRAVNVRDFSLMSAYEREVSSADYVHYTPDLPLHWTDCWQVRQDGTLVPRLMPAALTYLRFSWKHPSERFVATLSAGIASGTCHADALLHAFYELVERDAFAIAWLNYLSLPRIDVPTLESAYLQDSRERLLADGFRLTFVDLTTEIGIPVYLAVIQQSDCRMGNVNWFAPGLGANLSPMKALQRAYSEALEMLVNFCSFETDGEIRPRHIGIDDTRFDVKEYFDSCEFLHGSSASVRLPSATPSIIRTGETLGELEVCLRKMHDCGIECYFADLTPSELWNTRYRLVRAFASHSQPHLYDWDCWRLDNPRLFLSPLSSGRRSAPLDERRCNLQPNPYAVIDRLR